MINTLTFGLGSVDPPGMNAARKGGWAIPQDELLKLPGWRQPKDADIAEAKRLLAEAGHAGGLSSAIMFNSGLTRRRGEAEMIAAQLARVGIQLRLDPKEVAVATKAEQEGDYSLTFSQHLYAPESDWSNWLHSRGGLAKSGIKDPELDRLIDEQYRELDEAKRKQLWHQIQRLLMDRLYEIPLIAGVYFIGYQPYVHGWGDIRAGQAVNMTWERTWLETGKAPQRG
jgi:peptide/nickel transport system substrate-binding protein